MGIYSARGERSRHRRRDRGLEKVYGEGPTAVAPSRTSPWLFRTASSRPSWGLRGRGRARSCTSSAPWTSLRRGAWSSGDRALGALGQEANAPQAGADGLRVPVLQPHPTLSAEENVLLPVLIAGKRPGRYGKRLDELLDLVAHGTADAQPDELSGGEQQRVAMASPDQIPRHHSGRRADGKPRFEDPPRFSSS